MRSKLTSIDDLIGHEYGNSGNSPDKEEEQQTASDLGNGKDRKKNNKGEKKKDTQDQTKEQVKAARWDRKAEE